MTKINWNKYASDKLKGKTIVEVRYMEKDERAKMGWCESPLCIFFDDGSYIFPSSDDEGNSAGALFGGETNGEDWTFPVC